MNSGKTIFSQILEFIPWRQFNLCVEKYHGDKKVVYLKCHEFFRVMLFAQITGRKSLSDIIVCLNSRSKYLYHIGIKRQISKSNLSHANNTRTWKIFYDFAQELRAEVKKLYKRTQLKKCQLNACVYALDSTTINLCLSLFPWATFRKTKSAVKAHTLLDLNHNIPNFVLISKGISDDVSVMDNVIWEAGSWYVMDRAYVDFERLYCLHTSQAWFVTRGKVNMKYKRVYSALVDKSKGILCDQRVRLCGERTRKKYPELIRRVKFVDGETGKKLIFLTNNMTVEAETIAKLYKNRWHVELFFKWIKQHLCVQSFFGRTSNAVKSQLWIAVCAYLLLSIIKKRLGLTQSYYEILQILGINVFVKTPILSLFGDDDYTSNSPPMNNQLELFHF